MKNANFDPMKFDLIIIPLFYICWLDQYIDILFCFVLSDKKISLLNTEMLDFVRFF